MDEQSLWQAVLGELEVTLSRANFTTWFKNTFIISLEDNEVVIAVPNSFTREWLEKKYKDQILGVLNKISKKNVGRIKFKVASRTEKLPKLILPEIESPKESRGTSLNPYFTFESFVIGPSNRLASAAAQAVVKNPGKTYNPLFIYGGVGLGKTHLMQAIGNKVVEKNKEMAVLYVTCEKFTNEFIRAVQTGKINRFKDRYRNIDILMIDDIQFLAGKEGTQEEFFHTFNDLHQANKQIAVTSDRPPKALSALKDRLISRFEGGMIADISPPDLETRIAILKQKKKEKGYEVPDEVVSFIASKVQRNIRELEGALIRLVATCQLQGETPSLDLANQILTNLGISLQQRVLTLEKILQGVASFYNLEAQDLLNKKRDKDIVHPRQITMYLLRHELNFSFPKIGRELKRDHSTIIHGCGRIEKEIIHNNDLKQEIGLIKERIYQE